MVLICKISDEERGGLDHRGSIWHWYFAIRHSELSPTPSQVSVDGSRDKATILVASRPFLVTFQPVALTHGPFCWEHPVLRGQRRVGGGFVVGQTVVVPCCPLYLPSECCSFLPSDDSPVCSQLTCCSAAPRPDFSAIISPRVGLIDLF